MVKKIPERIVIYTQDIQNIMGKSSRASRELMQKLRLIFNKQPGQCITVAEFCEYTGLTEEEVREFL